MKKKSKTVFRASKKLTGDAGKNPASPSGKHQSPVSDDSLPGEDKPEHKVAFRNPDPEEDIDAYRPGGLCPIEVGETIDERYRILDKVDSTHRCTSWVARDQKSFELVQLDIFSAKFSEKATNSSYPKYFRAFLKNLKLPETKSFQSELNELWIDSANGHHLCRVLEFGVLNVADWQRYSEVACFSANDCRNLISTLLQGLCELHDQGFTHGYLNIDNLIFTSVEANKLSDRELRDLLGDPTIEKYDPPKPLETDYNLPKTLAFSNNLEPFIKFKRQARLRAFPLLSKLDENLAPTILPHISDNSFGVYHAPETMYKGYPSRNVSHDIWAAGCVIYEIVTGMSLFTVSRSASSRLAHIQDTLGDIPDNLQHEWEIPLADLNERERDRYHKKDPLSKKIRRRLCADVLEEAIPVFTDEEHTLLVDLLSKMLDYDPSKRITTKEALKHPWFSVKSP